MDKEQVKKLRAICRDISVLYVEDDKDISIQLEKLIRKIFNNVEVEKNGLLGLENFTKNRQDIVITDISMPVMDGIEMSKKIKLINGDQNILITSAHNDVEYLVKLIEIGVDKFITKPIDMGGFLSSVSKIAVGIYREKRESLLETRLKSQQNLQKELLNTIAFPLAYFEDNAIIYANNSFAKQFFTEADLKDLSKFKLSHLFEDKKYITMDNDTLIKKIDKSREKIYSIMDVNKRVVKKYNASVTDIKNSNAYLLRLVNLDAVNTEIDRFNTQADYFPKRETFLQSIQELKNNPKNNYQIFCVGLKNVKKFIDKYGGVRMHSIYSSFAKSLKEEFAYELNAKTLSIYLFETNRYVFLVQNNSNFLEKRFSDFGKRHSYSFGSGQTFDLDFVRERHSVLYSNVLESVEGMLYMFK